MKQPPLNAVITFTQPSQRVWHVNLDGKRVGTVNGDSSCDFIAREFDYHSIGYGYFSAEAKQIPWCLLGAGTYTPRAIPGSELDPSWTR